MTDSDYFNLAVTTARAQWATDRHANAAERALTVRIALLESMHRYRIELTAAQKHLRDAIDEDRTELIEDAMETVERLRLDIGYILEELAL